MRVPTCRLPAHGCCEFLIRIVTLADRPGGVLVSGSEPLCDVCLRLIHLFGTNEYVSSDFCNCKSESKRESETELKDSRQTIFGVYRGRGFGTPPYLRKRRVPKGD